MALTHAHAVVIGVSQYRRVPPLPSVADAEGVAGVLCDPHAGGYDPANVVLLQESDATREQILDELERLAENAGPDATALVYFSGHGGSWPGGDSYLVPIEGEWSSLDRLEATAISGQRLADMLAAIRAGWLTVVLDCCHAVLSPPPGAGDTWVPAVADGALERLAGRGRVVMAAARSAGGPHVLAGARHSLFTEHLIAGLRGAAGGSDGVVRVLDLFHHVERNVVARFPDQRPVLKAELADNYTVALCPRAVTPALATAARSDFVYDVLLVYAPDDRDRGWARVFFQLLEDRGVRVCAEELDTEPGGQRLRELGLVSTSRFTMPVLTPRFSAARFQELQTVLTHQLGTEDGIARLIPVVREPCGARLHLRSLVALEMIRDENVVPGIEKLVRTLRREPTPRPRPR
jgi:hypothetical protein